MSTCQHCGCGTKDRGPKPRSVAQLRRFFGMLRAMYQHWPDGDDIFQPHSEEHLRKWVICKAGRGKIVTTLTLPHTDNPSLAAAMMMVAEKLLELDNRFGRWRGMTLAVYEAESIAFHSMSPAEFSQLNDDVEAVYRQETGLDPEQVLRETEKAA